MINEKTFLKIPLNFTSKIKIYPPSLREVMEEDFFPYYKKILTLSYEEIEDEYTKKEENVEVPTPFDYLFLNYEKDEQLRGIIVNAFQFFIHQPVNFILDPKVIVVGDLEQITKDLKSVEDLPIINANNYFNFQNQVRLCLGQKMVDPPNPDEDPRIKRMKAKMRLRDKVKAKKGGGISLSTSLLSLCCMGIGITPLNIGELPYASLSALTHTFQEKDKYETEVRSLQAGADPKKLKPKYWIRDLED